MNIFTDNILKCHCAHHLKAKKIKICFKQNVSCVASKMVQSLANDAELSFFLDQLISEVDEVLQLGDHPPGRVDVFPLECGARQRLELKDVLSDS